MGAIGFTGTNGRLNRTGHPSIVKRVRAAHYNIMSTTTPGDGLSLCHDDVAHNRSRTVLYTNGRVNG